MTELNHRGGIGVPPGAEPGAAATARPGLLAGLRVADLSRTVAGGFCAKLLADLGARVVRLTEGLPDASASLEPEVAALPEAERAVLDLYLHGGKERVSLDPFAPEHRARLGEVLAESALAVEDLSPPEREALGWEARLAELAPPPIDVSVTDFGLSGPLAGRAATELTRYGWSGQLSLNGEPGAAPLGFPGWMGAYLGGLHACVGALLALRVGEEDRNRTAAIRVEHAAVEGLAAAHQLAVELCQRTGAPQGRLGNRHYLSHPNTLLRARDGWVVAAMTGAAPPELLAALTEDPAFSADPRFASPDERMRHWRAVDSRLGGWLGAQSRDAAAERAQSLQLPFGRVLDLGEVLKEPHYAERGFWRQADLPGGRRVTLPGLPFRVRFADSFRSLPLAQDGGGKSGMPAAFGLNASTLAPDDTASGLTQKEALPLTGLRVLELSVAWAGPMAGRILAEFGAEVARIEWRPAEAPEPRPATAPPIAGGTAGREMDGEAANEANLAALHRAAHHRGKASVAIDLAGEGGRRLLRRLVAECGVLLENFRPGVLEGWGCGYDAMAAENPALVMLSLSGFGATGPRSPWRALGSTVEGEAGWCALMGEAEGPPLKHGEALADPVAALNGLAVLLAALRSRDASGRGMHIDLSQAECALRQIGERIGLRSLEAKEPERRGNRHTAMAPHGVYPCAGADRWLAVSVRSGEEWRRLCGALGWGDWAEDRELACLPGRLGRRDDIDRRLAGWSAARAPEQAQAILDEAGVTCAPVLGVAELRQWAHLSARGGFVELEFAGGGMLSHVRTPLTVSGMALSGIAPHHRPAAPYGADTARVLGAWLGMDVESVRALAREGVVALAEERP